jgi:predicted kinase
MCGLPGSGKSTWAKNIVDSGNALCVSRDAIRSMVGAGKYVFNKEMEPVIKDVAHYGICSLLEFNNVVVDETHITKQSRRDMVDTARMMSVEPIIVHCFDVDGCIDRRMSGDARGYTREKWKEVIEGMMLKFEVPTEDECQIIRVGI